MTEKDPAADRLEQLVDQFDALWQQGSGPKWTEWLRQAGSAVDQTKMARLLVPIELEYRRQRGETIEPEQDYPEASAEQLALVRELLTPSLHDDATLAPNRAAAKVNSPKDPSSQTIGPYKLLQKLGEGGMGEVWMAEQKEPVKRRVALKLIKTGLDNKQVIARFEAERQALAMMDHPNIARVLDAGTTSQGQPYFVMELVQGIPFNSYCDQHKLSIDQRLRLFIPVCQAIQHAHQKGIIHRDLKPANVLVSLCDGQPVPKVIDFGLAKALQPTTHLTDKTMFTEFGQVVGTLQYMSPEQAEMNQLDVDTRADIYSLGVMLYELLTGSTPIDRETMRQQAVLQVLHAIREQEPPRPSARLSSSTQEAVSGISSQRQIDPTKLKSILRGELDWIVMRALEKDRTRRYETPSGFAEDIQRYLEGEPVLARPPSAGYRLSKYVRRNKGLVASLASIAALLIGGIIGTSWFAIEANRAREVADRKTAEVVAEKENVLKQKQVAESAEFKAKAEASNAQLAKEKTVKTLARSNYYLAISRWNEGRTTEARFLLQQIPEQYRSFEWSHILREIEGSEVTIYGHSDAVTSVDFSKDGKWIVSGSADNTVKLWDSVSGEEVRTLYGHSDKISSVAFSSDGRQIVSGSKDKTLKLWDTATGIQTMTFVGHTGTVTGVSFSSAGTQIISASHDNTIRIWDCSSGDTLRTLQGHEHRITCVAVSPDCKKIASGGEDNKLKIWDANTWEILHSIDSHKSSVRCVAFSPDSSQIVSGGGDNMINLLDAETGEVLKTLSGHNDTVAAVTFSPDGNQIISGSHDNSVRLWNALNGEEIASHFGHRDFISSIALSPDGARIVTSGQDKSLKIWDASNKDKPPTFTGHRDQVMCLAVSPDSKRIASGGKDTKVSIWDPLSMEEVLTLEGHGDYVTCLAFSTDGKIIVSGSYDSTIKIWDAKSGKILKSLAGHSEPVSSIALSRDGKWVASSSWDKTIKLWDTVSGTILKTFTGHEDVATSVAFTIDGTQIASGSDDSTIKLWDISTGKNLRTLTGHKGPVTSIAVSPDGNQLLSGSYDQKVKLWELASGQELMNLVGHSYPVFTVAFSPDGQRAVSGGYDKTIKIWDPSTGEDLRTLKQHQDWVSCLAFSRDGKRLFSGSIDQTVKLWDTHAGEELGIYAAHSDIVSSVAISPDRRYFASASFDDTVKLWELSTGSLIKTLTSDGDDISDIAFSEDNMSIISRDIYGKLGEWPLGSGRFIKTAKTQAPFKMQSRSSDGGLLAIGSGCQVALVDLGHEKSPEEQARRKRFAKIKVTWHREQATSAESREDWYAATFHLAWAVKGKPDSAEDHEALKADFAKLKEKSPEQAERLAKLLPAE